MSAQENNKNIGINEIVDFNNKLTAVLVGTIITLLFMITLGSLLLMYKYDIKKTPEAATPELNT